MPPQEEPPVRSLQEIAAEVGVYPLEALQFVEQGLAYAVKRVHGDPTSTAPEQNRHVSGQELCEGLRELALLQWGLLARTVLQRWGITGLMAVLVLWLAGLLVMYFTTVQPRRQPATDAAHRLDTLP